MQQRLEALLFLVVALLALGSEQLGLRVEPDEVDRGEERLLPAEVAVTFAVIQEALVYSTVHDVAGSAARPGDASAARG